MAGAAPLNGTKVGCTPSTEWSSRQVVFVIEPMPACAGFQFERASALSASVPELAFRHRRADCINLSRAALNDPRC
jgi:hypothetical protein